MSSNITPPRNPSLRPSIPEPSNPSEQSNQDQKINNAAASSIPPTVSKEYDLSNHEVTHQQASTSSSTAHQNEFVPLEHYVPTYPPQDPNDPVRKDFKGLSELWNAYTEQNKNPTLYVKIKSTGSIVECRSREAVVVLYGEKGVNAGAIADEMDQPVLFDPLVVAEILVNMKPNFHEKKELAPFVQSLKDLLANELNNERNSGMFTKFINSVLGRSNTVRINTLEQCIRALEVNECETAISASYPHAVTGVNNCDFTWENPSLKAAVIFDGVGHDDERVVRDQHPIFRAITNHFEEFLKTFDPNQPDFEEAFHKQVTANLRGYSEAFRGLSDNYETTGESIQARFNDLQGKVVNQIQKSGNISKQEFDEFCEVLNKKKVEERLTMMRHVQETGSLTDLDLKHKVLLESLNEQDYPKFCAALNSMSIEEYRAANNYIRADYAQFVGAASLFAHVMTTPNGSYLYTAQYADCCYLVLNPDKSATIIPECSQSQGMLPRGNYVTQRFAPIAPGSIVFGYSDGIGEFLTGDEVESIVRDNIDYGLEQTKNALINKIKEYPKADFDDRTDETRLRASRPSQPCKKFDPSGTDAQCVDDISMFVLRVPGEANSASSVSQQPTSSSH